MTLGGFYQTQENRSARLPFPRYAEGMNIGRALIFAGLFLLAAGVLFTLGDKLPFRIGRLPGDLVVRGKNTTLYFPVVTCIVLSIIGSVILWLIGRR